MIDYESKQIFSAVSTEKIRNLKEWVFYKPFWIGICRDINLYKMATKSYIYFQVVVAQIFLNFAALSRLISLIKYPNSVYVVS